jgi:hypothetical protein
MLIFAALLLAASAAAPPGPAALTLDLDGDGKPETVRAIASGSKIKVEVDDASGKRITRMSTVSPGKGAGVTLAAGPLGEAGSVLEIAATAAGRECRTFWRLRSGKMEGLPLTGVRGRLPECFSAGEWTGSWKQPTNDAPAYYERESVRATPRGELHRTQAFRFAGFDLQYDPKRSHAEIAGVSIPDIAPVALYPKPLVEALLSCFDLSGFRSRSRLRIFTDPDEGIFDAVLEGPREKKQFQVTEAKPGGDAQEFFWTVNSGGETGRLRVRLALDGRTPVEIAGQGEGEQWNLVYNAVVRRSGGHLEVFASAEDALATQSLPGGWDSKVGSRILVSLLTTSPAVIQFGKQKVAVNLTEAPSGADVLLVPRDGSSPRTALRLRGPNAFTSLPVDCSGRLETCRIRPTGEEFRRLGTPMNVR